MKELRHDIESYIITIRRKGQQIIGEQNIAAVPTRIKPLTHESSDPGTDHQEGTGDLDITEITAPLPGIIVSVKVKVGDTVSEGQELAVLEAMKMENSIESPRPGTVKAINVSVGDTVSEGIIIMTIG